MNKRGTMIDPEEDRRFIHFTDVQLQRMADCYREGWSSRRLAARYGISPTTVQRRLVAMGITLRGTGKNHVVTDAVMQTARRMRGDGIGWRHVEAATGVNARSIMCAMLRERRRRQRAE